MSLLVLFFFLMLFMPTIYQGPRALLLIVILLVTFRTDKKLYINKDIRLFWMLTYFVAVYALLIGIFRGNPGTISCIPFFLIWPILYLYFIIRCDRITIIKTLLKTITFGGLIVASLNILLIANAYMLHINFLNLVGDALKCEFNIQEGFAEYFSPSGNHLPYLIYFCTTLLFLKPKTIDVKKKYLLVTIGLSIIDIALSNRRAMWLVILILPLILFAFFSFLKKQKKILLKIGVITFASGLMIFTLLINFLDFDYVYSEVLSSFDFSGDESSNLERVIQGKSLWEDFLKRPLLGSGLGHVSHYVRNMETPWTYELTYNYTLASVGLFGFIIYAISTCWICIKAVSVAKKSSEYATMLIPQIMGLISLLIISISNPYLVKFDFVWAIFLPLATINAIYNEKRREKTYFSILKSR